MATRISSDNLAKTINADGYSIGGGTTKRTATVTGGDQTFSGSGSSVYTFPGYSGKLLTYKRGTVSDVPYTVTTSDYLVSYTTLTAARTITLPAASTMTDRVILINDESATPGRFGLTLDGNASETINGQLTWVFYTSITIYCTGSAWFVMDDILINQETASCKYSLASYNVVPSNYCLILTPGLTLASTATLLVGSTGVLKILAN